MTYVQLHKLVPSDCRVMIFTVHKETTNIQRHCFNNCFDNGEFSTGNKINERVVYNQLFSELLWKVARYTTAAAPVFYEEVDNYIDGGFLANNPCQAAWTEIHKYQESRIEPTVIVSVGSGIPKHVAMKETSLTNWKQLFDMMVLLVCYSYHHTINEIHSCYNFL